MENNFFDLLKYAHVPELNKSPDEVLDEIDVLFDNANDKAYDLINYERLIYLDMKYKDNDMVSRRINELKNFIADNYKTKELLKNRYIHIPENKKDKLINYKTKVVSTTAFDNKIYKIDIDEHTKD